VSESDNLDTRTTTPGLRPEPENMPEPETMPETGPELLAPAPAFAEAPPPPKAEVFWGWHDFVVFLCVTILALGLAMLVGLQIKRIFHLSESRMNIVFVVAQFAAYGVSFTCLKLMSRAEYGEPLLPSLRWVPVDIELARLGLMGLGQAFLVALIGAFMNIPQTETPMNKLLSDRPTALVIALIGVTLAPLAEELAFRGLLQPLLIRSVGVAPGIFLTSLLFGAMHLEQYGAWQSVVLITLAGAGFGTVRYLTGSTRASAIMHAGYNSALFILFFAQRGPHA
jgi:membrane protease YdiL (CAAX protease family)